MRCVKVPKEKGEEVRNKLLEKNLLSKNFKIGSEDEYLFIPIKKGDVDLDLPVVDRELEKREKKETDYREKVDVPTELKKELPSSYDIIGDIAVLKIPESLSEHRSKIGDAILEAHKNVEIVLEDEGVKGDFRIRDVSVIAGEDRTTTVHKEYGVELEIDITQAYFSPRLATERWRVTEQVQPGERVFDMFAGIGPYTVLIAKRAEPEHVYSADINPEAVELLRKNIERNGIGSKVSVYEGDAAKIAENIEAERIIMNLPHDSFTFLRPAVDSLSNEGTIHYYEMIQKNREEERKEEILAEIEETGNEGEVRNTRIVKTYSVDQIHIAYDLYIKR